MIATLGRHEEKDARLHETDRGVLADDHAGVAGTRGEASRDRMRLGEQEGAGLSLGRVH